MVRRWRGLRLMASETRSRGPRKTVKRATDRAKLMTIEIRRRFRGNHPWSNRRRAISRNKNRPAHLCHGVRFPPGSPGDEGKFEMQMTKTGIFLVIVGTAPVVLSAVTVLPILVPSH